MSVKKRLNKDRRRSLKEWNNRFWSFLLTVAMLLQSTPVSAMAETLTPSGNAHEQQAAPAPDETAPAVEEQTTPDDAVVQDVGEVTTPVIGDSEAAPVEEGVVDPVLGTSSTSDQSQQVEPTTTPTTQEQVAQEPINVVFNLENATVSILGEELADTQATVSVPAGQDLSFVVTPAEDYVIADDTVTFAVDGTEYAVTPNADKSYTIKAADMYEGFAINVKPAKSVYTYEDDNLKVTATLEDATAIPNDATLWVNGIYEQTLEVDGVYNYDAYMEALNAAAQAPEDQPVYTQDNTLLYDVAFLVADPDTGVTKEIEPEAGKVSVKFEFKKDQLAEQLDAEQATDVEVTHLPLVDSAKADTTAQATNIEATDVIVESIADKDVTGEGTNVLEVVAQDFSVFAVSLKAAPMLGASNVPNYDIKININPAGLNVVDSDLYFVFLKGQASNGQTAYYLGRLNIGSGQSTVTIPVQYGGNTTDWVDNNGNRMNNATISPNTVEAFLVKAESGTPTVSQINGGNNIEMLGVGGNVKNYGIESINPSSNNVTINLGPLFVDSVIRTPEEILGDAHEFGITAITYIQAGHTETNFAVHNSDVRQNIDVDGSGDACVPFYAANLQHVLWVSEKTKNDVDIFIPQSERGKIDEQHFNIMRRRGQEINVDTSLSADQIKSYVNDLISHGQTVSNQLIGATTIAPVTTQNHYTLDVTSFPDGTIYVDADGLLPAISQNGGLTIKKNPNQSIVFNFKGNYPNDSNPLKIAKYKVECDGKTIDTTTEAMGDSDHISTKNQNVDNYIFEHIFWNAPNAGRVILEDAAGLFLFPQSQYVTQSNGAGWILSGGTVESQGSSEWHFYRHKRHYKAKGDFTLQALKKLVNSNGDAVAFENRGYTFDLYATDANGKITGGVLETQTANGSTGQVEFQQFHYSEQTVPKNESRTFYYAIVERMPEGGTDNGNGTYTWQGILYNAKPIYVKVVATNTPTSQTQGNISFQISYKCEGANQFVNASETAATVYSVGTLTNTKENVSTDIYVRKADSYQWGDSDKFEFTLTALDNAPMPTGSSNGKKTISVINSLGNHFGTMQYSAPGTYKYTVQEIVPDNAVAVNLVNGYYPTYKEAKDNGYSQQTLESTLWRDKNGIKYDASLHTITVTVSGSPMKATVVDDHDSKVTAENAKVTFNNEREELGSLKLRKRVTVNGKSVTDSDADDKAYAEKYIHYTDGTYVFELKALGTIASEFGIHTVHITMKDGVATSAIFDKGEPTEATLSIDRDGYAEVPGLTPGNYMYTEILNQNPANVHPAGGYQDVLTVVAGKTSYSVPSSAKGSVTNNYSPGGFKIEKIVSENRGRGISKDALALVKGDYKFAVYTDEDCTTPAKDEDGKAITVKLTVGDDGAPVTSDEISGLAPGTYYVKETSKPSDYVKPLSDPLAVTVRAGNTGDTAVIATMGNNIDTGGLVVKKTIESDLASDKKQEFTFTVTLADTSISGTFGDMTFKKGVATFTLKDGETKSATSLPRDLAYTVTEADAEGFITSYTQSTTSGTVTEGKTASGTMVNPNTVTTFNNKRRTGGFDLSKELVSDLAADAREVFHFTITLSDKSISGTYGDATFTDGVAQVELKGGEKAEIRNLPYGVTYTVEETADAAFNVTHTINGQDASVEEVAVGAVINKINFKNERKPGGLSVTKIVSTTDAASKEDKNKSFAFRVTLYNDAEMTEVATNISKAFPQTDGSAGVTFANGVAEFSLKGGETMEIAYLPAGIYYKAEEFVDDTYTTPGAPAGWVIVETGSTGQIVPDTLTKANFTNTKDEGTLNVYKSVISKSGNDKKKDFHFVVTLYQKDDATKVDSSINGTYGDMEFTNGVATFELKDGQNKAASGLPNGIRYKVVEQREDGKSYETEGFTVKTVDDEGQLFNNTSKAARFENTKDDGPITISKKVVSPLPADKAATYFFTIELNDTSINGTFDGVTFVDGKAENIAVAGDTERVINGLPVGTTFTVTEAAVDNMSTTATPAGSNSAVATGTIVKGGVKVEFTNERNPADITISKEVVSDFPPDENQEFTFTVTLDATGVNGKFDTTKTLADGTTQNDTITFKDSVATGIKIKDKETFQIKGLPAGVDYEVTEAVDNTYETESKRAKGTLAPSLVAAFKNTRKTGGLEIKKTVVSSTASDMTKKFTFDIDLTNESGTRYSIDKSFPLTITKADGTEEKSDLEFKSGSAKITLAHGETALIEGLPIGIKYVVEEAEKNKDGFSTTWTGAVDNITTSIKSCHYTNSKIEGGLVVYKKVNSPVASDLTRDFNFTVTLDDTSVNGTYGDMEFKDGVATFTLKNGESKSATGLAQGIKYTVDEVLTDAEKALYKLSWNGGINEGTIADDTAVITAQNDRIPGELDVTKVVKSNKAIQTIDKTRKFKFKVELGEAISGTFDDMTFVDGVAEFELSDGQTAVAKNLPVGVTYTVSEETPTGYTLVKSGETGSIGSTVAKATFTNKRLYTAASIKKIWDDGDDHDGFRPDKITVDLLANGISIGTVELSKANNWSAEITKLPLYSDDGKPFTYTWKESGVDKAKYTVTSASKDATFTFDIEGEEYKDVAGTHTDMTNSYVPVPTVAEVEKVWNDNEDNDARRPEKLTVGLFVGDDRAVDMGGKAIGDIELNEANKWFARVTNLPKYKDGKEITYTWKELDLPAEYTLSGSSQAAITWEDPDGNEIVGYKTTLTNSYDVEMTTAKVQKVWNDKNDKAGFRPDELVVKLLADYGDGKGAVDTGETVTLNAANKWTAAKDNLPAYKNKVKIAYSWDESSVPDHYTLTGNVTNGTLTTITNTIDEEFVEATVQKVWNDKDNQDGMRPAFLKVELLQNGKSMDPKVEVTLNEGNNWTFTQKDLDKYLGGKLVEYTWAEDEAGLPAGYSLTGNVITYKDPDGADLAKLTDEVASHVTTLTNGKDVETVQARIIKDWDDEEDKAKLRPTEVTFSLQWSVDGRQAHYADGASPAEGKLVDAVTLDASNNWTATVENLPKYNDGKEIEYFWSELDNGLADAGYAYSTDVDNWTVANFTDDAGNVLGVATTATNVLDTGDLTVSKKLISTNSADKTKEFTFTVELSNPNGKAIDINGTYGDMTFTNNVATVTVKGGESKTATKLPAGLTYTVTEANADGFKVTGDTTTGKIVRNETARAEITNERETGDLKLSKELISKRTADKDQVFEFTITLGDTENNNKYNTVKTLANGKTEKGSIKFTDGVAHYELKGKESVLIKDLPTGVTYTITEASVDGFLLKGITVNSQDMTGNAQGTIAMNTTSEVEFTNERISGGLTLSKKLLSDLSADASHAFNFTVTLSDTTINGTYGDMTFTDGVAHVTIVGQNSANASDLPAGVTYTITEDSDPDFTVVGITRKDTGDPVDQLNDGEATGTILSNTPSLVEYTNQRKPGDLTVKKEVISSTASDHTKDFKFRVTLSDTNINGIESVYTDVAGNKLPYGVEFKNGVAEFTLKDNQTKLIDNLPTGVRYVVEEYFEPESEAGQWKITRTGETGTITGPGLNAQVDNERREGDLKLKKVVKSDIAADLNKEFTVTVNMNDENFEGEYAIDGGAADEKATFVKGVATITLKHNDEKTIKGLPAGARFTATEVLEGDDAKLYGFTWSGITSETRDSKSVTSTIKEDTTLAATVTNKRIQGGLTINKELALSDTDSDGNTAEFTFDVKLDDTSVNGKFSGVTFTNGEATVTITGEDSVTIEGLPADVGYTVTEQNHPGFTLKGITTDGDDQLADGKATGTIKATGSETTFKNERDYTNAKVHKVWNDDENRDGKRPIYLSVNLMVSIAGADPVLAANVTLNEGNGWTAEARNLPTHDAQGNELTYSWMELPQTAGYNLATLGYEQKAQTFKQWIEDNTVIGEFTTLTNERISEKVKVTLKKVWVDENNQDGKRPVTLTAQLIKNGDTANPVSTVQLTAGEDWAEKSIEDLPKYENGKLISYTWVEDEAGLPAGYLLTNVTTEESTDGVITTELTNSYNTEKTTASIQKVWDDANNQDGKRPPEIEVALLADGQPALDDSGNAITVKLSEDNKYFGKVENLDAFKNGTPIKYTWAEDETALAALGYTMTSNTTNGTLTSIVNTHKPEYVRARIRKEWHDQNNQDGKRPGYLTVKLLANGTEVARVTLTIANADPTDPSVWTYDTGKTLPKYNNGQLIEYEWEEDQSNLTSAGYALTTFGNAYLDENGHSVDIYDATVAPTYVEMFGTFGNDKTPDTVKAVIKKVWDDNNNLAKKQPAELEVTLLADGQPALNTYREDVSAVTLNAANNWTATVEGLPKNTTDATTGKSRPIKYTWAEDETALKTLGYTLTNTQVENQTDANDPTVLVGTLTTLTNTFESGEIELSKILISDAAADKDQEFKFTVELSDPTITGTFGDMTFDAGKATVNLKGGKSAKATGLPTGIDYTITEEVADGFRLTGITINGADQGNASNAHGTITSTPSSVEFTNRRIDGGFTLSKKLLSTSAADKNTVFTFHVKLSDTSINGTYGSITFGNGEAEVHIKGGDLEGAMGLPTGITYEITEDSAPNFKLMGITKNGAPSDGDGTKATGTISSTPDAIIFNNDHDKGDIVLKKELISDRAAAADQLFTFTVKLNDSTVDGTFGDATFAKGIATVTVKGNESKEIKGLPTGIAYTITEADARGYKLTGITVGTTEQTKAASGTIITEPSTVTFKNEDTKGELKVTKSVVSTNDADKDKEFNFKVTLAGLSAAAANKTYGDMAFTDGVAEFTLKHGESKATGMTLPSGITYTVEEETPDGWVTTKTGETGSIVAEETRTAEFTNDKTEGVLRIKKVVDSIFETDKTRNYGFIVTLSDTTINGVFGDLTFTNGVSARFTLHDGDEAVATGLPEGITYSVDEDLSDQQRQTLDDPTWTNQTGTIGENAVTTVTATNHRKTGSITVTKRVDSHQANDKTKKFSFKVTLYDGDNVATKINGTYGDRSVGKTMTFTDGVATFELAKDEAAYADKIPFGVGYKVEETTPAGYELTWHGNTEGTISEATSAVSVEAANKRIETNASIKKVWDDEDNKDGMRPIALTVNFIATINGVETVVSSEQLNASNDWSAAYTNIPAYSEAGQPITYKWTEVVPANYKQQADGASYTVESTVGDQTTTKTYVAGTTTTNTGSDTIFINKHDVEKVNTSVKKVWDDNSNQDGMRPGSLNVRLMVNGVDKTQELLGRDHVSLSESNEWSYTVKDLDRYAGGNELHYSWAEDESGLPTGYILTNTAVSTVTDAAALAEITGTEGIDETTLTTLTNSYKPKKTTATVKKVWNDNNDSEGFRPKSITVSLMKTVATEGATATKVQDVTLSDDNNWTETIGNLDVYENGKYVIYSWVEDEESLAQVGYKLDSNETTGTVTTLTNTRIPTFTEATIKKVWRDGENQDGTRPVILQVQLNKMVVSRDANGNVIGASGGVVGIYTLSEANNWQLTIDRLPEYQNGGEVTYSWVELPSFQLEDGTEVYDLAKLGYTLNTDESGTVGTVTTLTNVHIPETTEVQVWKVWNTKDAFDDMGQGIGRNAHKIPDELTVKLLANGQQAKDAQGNDIVVTLNVGNDWQSEVIKNLPKFSAGKAIEYTWQEDVPTGYVYTRMHMMPLYGVGTDANGNPESIVVGEVSSLNNELETGDLIVAKTVTSDLTSDLTKKFHFTVTLDDKQINGTYGDFEFKDGVAEFDLKDGEQRTTHETMDLFGDGSTIIETATLPAGIGYTVEEKTEEGFTTTWYGKTGTIKANDTVGAWATNKREKGGFQVTKAVVSDKASDLNKQFEFTVELGKVNGETISGTYGDMTFTDGVATFELANGQSAVAADLPVGVTYKVTETADDNYDTTIKGDVEGKVVKNTTPDATPIVTFTNTKNNGPLTINKSVVSDVPADKDATFTFTIQLTDEHNNAIAFNGRRSGVQFVNGEGTVEIKANATKTINGLPVGAHYRVVEAEATSATWATTSTGDAGVITAAGVTANFTNTHNPGDLEVTKTVVSNTTSDKTNAKQFDFTVTLTDANGDTLNITKTYGGMSFKQGVAQFSLAHGQTNYAFGLPVGITYTVEEKAEAGWITTKTGETGTIASGTKTAGFVNTKDEGGLVVTKKVISPFEADHTDQEFTFMVALYDENDQRIEDFAGTFGSYKQTKDGQQVETPITFTKGVETFTLRDGQSWTALGLPAGVHYKVFETENPNFDQTWENNEGVIQSNTTSAATVVTATNTRKPGELQLTKNLISPIKAEQSQQFTFHVTLTDANDKPLEGTFYVAGETPYSFDKNGQTIVLVAGGETKTITGLPVGAKYTVTEDSTAGFKLTGKTGEAGTISTTPSIAGFRNERELGDLEVSKALISDAAADKDLTFHFTVDLRDDRVDGTFGDMTFNGGTAEFDLKGGETKKATGLPAGVGYAVSEKSADGFAVTGTTGTRGTIETDKTTKATIENTRLTGRLELFKIVHSHTEADFDKIFTFRVTLIGENGINKTYPAVFTDQDNAMSDTTVTFQNGVALVMMRADEDLYIEELPMDTKYKIEEVDAEDENFTKAWDTWANKDDVEGKIQDIRDFATGPTGKINNTKRAQVDFHNDRREGDLLVSKEVVSNLKADEEAYYNFTVTLSDTTVNGSYGDMTFVDGEAALTLKGGESAIATGLPAFDDNGNAVTYTVSENAVDYFTTTVKTAEDGEATKTTEAKGSIVEDETANALFTNTREKGDLEVSKILVSDNVADANQSFTFTVDLHDETINGRFAPDDQPAPEATEDDPNPFDPYMTFENGVATFTITGGEMRSNGELRAKGQTKKAEGLPAGVYYTVTEENAPGFILNNRTDYEGTITTTPSRAVFTNARTKAPLTVTKVVDSDLAADHDEKFSFTVELSDTSITGTYGEMKFENGIATFELADGESKSADNLPTGIGYKVTEKAVEGMVTTWVGNVDDEFTEFTEDGAEVRAINTRETSDLEVTKKVKSNSDHDKTLEFNFKVELSDKTISGDYFEMTFDKGVAEFTLKDGETKVAKGLPVGVEYTVTETSTPDVVESNFVTKTKGAEDTITAGETKTATFTNIFSDGEAELFAVKTVTSSDMNHKVKAGDFSFTLTDETTGESTMAFNEEPDENGVSKATFAPITYTLADLAEVDENGNVTYAQSKDFTYTIAEVVPADAVNEAGETYAEAADKTALFLDKATSTYYQEQAQTVTVTVAQAKKPGADLVVTYNGNDTFEGAPFENVYVAGQIQLDKTVVTDLVDGIEDEEHINASKLTDEQRAKITFTVTDENGNEIEGSPVSLADCFPSVTEVRVNEDGSKNVAVTYRWVSGKLPVGKYSVVETNAMYDWIDTREYTITTRDENGNEIDIPSPEEGKGVNEITGDNQTAKIKVQDTLAPSKLALSKSVVTPGGKTIKNLDQEFTFHITLSSLPDTWNGGSFKVEGGAEGETIAFAEPDENGTTTGTLTLKAGEEKVIDGLPINTSYIVTEEATEGFVLTGVTANEDQIVDVNRAVHGKVSDTKVTTYTADFTNTMAVSGKGLILVQKILKGRAWTTDDEFTFTLSAVDGAPMPAKNTVTIKKDGDIDVGSFDLAFTSSANGNSYIGSFGEINFDAEGTYNYIVKEVKGSIGGITYDETEHPVTITMVEDENGDLVAAEGDEAIVVEPVTNTYAPKPGIGEIKIKKTIDGREWTKGDKFSFTLSADEGTPMPEKTEITITDETKEYTDSFGKIEFTKPGEYTYTVKEVAGNIAGITYDEKAHEVEITVVDDGKGNLVASESSSLDNTVTIVNPYKPGTGDLAVKKTVSSSTASDKTAEYGFKVTLSDKTITGTFGDMKFEKGVATFTLKHNETKTAKGLPIGVTYTVEETDSKGLTKNMSGGTGKIAEKKATATCTNTRPTTPPNTPSVPPSTTTTTKGSATLAKTGDMFDPTVVGIMFGLGLVLVVVGTRKRRRNAA